jgi:biotin operon repressor
VAAHREIVAAYEALQASPRTQQVTVRLPRANAPQGRSLHDDEYVPVTWTVEAREDTTIQDKTERRRHHLLRLLGEAWEQGAIPRDQDLADALGVSLRTVRRDITALRAQGHNLPTRRRLQEMAS